LAKSHQSRLAGKVLLYSDIRGSGVAPVKSTLAHAQDLCRFINHPLTLRNHARKQVENSSRLQPASACLRARFFKETYKSWT
jgi:hypothetical protein